VSWNSRLSHPLGDEPDFRHDFGTIIRRPELELVHTYEIRNRSDRPIKLQARNGKPCCGSIDFNPTALRPGEATSLQVTLRAGDTIGPLQHYTILETEHPELPTQEYWTTAQIHPRVRIERSDSRVPELSPGQSRSVRFTLLTYHSSSESPDGLDEVAIQSESSFDWEGPPRERTLSDGLIERARDFSLVLEAALRSGPKADEIRVVDGPEVLLTHPVRWNVRPAIDTSPRGLVLLETDGPGERLTLRARDGQPFVIEKVETKLNGLRIGLNNADSTEAAVQSIEVATEPGTKFERRAGALMITTSHPVQPTVEVGLFVSRP